MKKLIKNALIAKSGIYEYREHELSNLGLKPNFDTPKKDIYKVYRPAYVLLKSIDKFSRLPVLIKTDTYTHPEDYEDQKNWEKYGVGVTGDKAVSKYENGEVSLYTPLTISGSKGIQAYMNGVKEVSPGYYATFKWHAGKSFTGEDFDIVMQDISEVDHLLITTRARGGQECKIFDSQEGGKVVNKILSGLIYQIKKNLKKGVGDADMGHFRGVLEETVKNRSDLNEEGFATSVGKLNNFISDLPDSEDKELLGRYINELPIMKEESDDVATEAAGQIASLFERLDVEAMRDKPTETSSVGDSTQISGESVEEVPVVEGTGDSQVEQTGDMCGGTSDTTSMSSDYVLSEMFQLLQKWNASKTGDATATTIKETSTESNKLEDYVAGPDKQMELEQSPKDTTLVGDSSTTISPTIDLPGSTCKSISEIFKDF